jgi:hypothetical protein
MWSSLLGAGTVSDTYHRITAVSADNTIGIAKTAGDTVITTNHYAVVLGPSIVISSTVHSSGITTFNCSAPHGLFGGNKFRVTDSASNNLGDYIVKEKVDIDTFTALTPNISATSGYILKHGLSSNKASSDSSAENLGNKICVHFLIMKHLTAVSLPRVILKLKFQVLLVQLSRRDFLLVLISRLMKKL